MALGLQLFQQTLQVDPGDALDAKRTGDVALGRKRGVFGNPGKDLLFGWNIAHAERFSMGASGRRGENERSKVGSCIHILQNVQIGNAMPAHGENSI